MEGVILSSWDYIMGPQIERLWLTNYKPKLNSSEVPLSILREFNISKHYKESDIKDDLKRYCDLRLYSLMCGQLLLGEMDSSDTMDKNVSRTYISDSKILISVVFRVKSWIFAGTTKEVNNVCLCVGLLYKRDAFDFILQNQFTVDVHLRKLADILQKPKVFQDSVFTALSDTVAELILLLDSLHHSNLDHIQNHVLSSIQDCSTSTILTEAVVSHLQTSGHTVVLGGSEFKINQVIKVLSLFSNREELQCSMPINRWPLKSKVSALYIQGIVKNSEKDYEYLLEHAFEESISLTVIDTDLCKVWQTWPLHENVEKNRVFSSVTETGHLVPDLLKDLSFASKNNADSQVIIENFMKLLMMKAVAIIKTVSHFRDIKRVPSRRELMTLFGLYTLVDLQILLGCAEKLKSGIRYSIS